MKKPLPIGVDNFEKKHVKEATEIALANYWI